MLRIGRRRHGADALLDEPPHCDLRRRPPVFLGDASDLAPPEHVDVRHAAERRIGLEDDSVVSRELQRLVGRAIQPRTLQTSVANPSYLQDDPTKWRSGRRAPALPRLGPSTASSSARNNDALNSKHQWPASDPGPARRRVLCTLATCPQTLNRENAAGPGRRSRTTSTGRSRGSSDAQI